eukprot:TRINITY_DN17176_c0_g1_i2.p1 TRINITY_DN17176_c0_g1~~TRINITY_DN17176_c0_g1_i2.p1  ORF type:complete len:304 (+),score=75.83 TRINITY_DN17176_c0_g1_i2:137-1048(+)
MCIRDRFLLRLGATYDILNDNLIGSKSSQFNSTIALLVTLNGDRAMGHFPDVICSGEIRVEMTAHAWTDDDHMHVSLKGVLFEGVTGDTDDKEDQEYAVVELPLMPGSEGTTSIFLENTEFFGGDTASVTVTACVFTEAQCDDQACKEAIKVAQKTPMHGDFRYVRELTGPEMKLVRKKYPDREYYYVVEKTLIRKLDTPEQQKVIVKPGFLCDGCSGGYDKLGEANWLVHDWIYASPKDHDGNAIVRTDFKGKPILVTKTQADGVLNGYRNLAVLIFGAPAWNAPNNGRPHFLDESFLTAKL